MEYHGTRLPARARRPEPSWPTVIATTLRLWLERHPVVGRRGTRGRRVTVALAAVGAAALGAGVAVAPSSGTRRTSARLVGAGRRGAERAGSAGALGASAATRAEAASWIAGQVASSAVVACDPAMCAALQADGLPAARLLVLGTAVADPLGSDVVVATACRPQPVRRPPGERLRPGRHRELRLGDRADRHPGDRSRRDRRRSVGPRRPTAAAGSPRVPSCCATRASPSPPAPGRR